MYVQIVSQRLYSFLLLQIVGEKAVSAVGKPLYPIPTERAGSATEISATILLLVSQSGSFINGQEIVLDGGYLAVNPSTR